MSSVRSSVGKVAPVAISRGWMLKIPLGKGYKVVGGVVVTVWVVWVVKVS